MAKETTRRGQPQGVPVFVLYGEAGEGPDVEFLHIEPISARSERHGWEISAHTHRGLFQALFVFDKMGRVTLDNRVIEVGPPAAILVPAGVVHAFHFEPGTEGLVLTLAASWASAAGDARMRAAFAGLMDEPGAVDLGDDAAQIRALLDMLTAEMRDDRTGRALMSEWLVAAILVALLRRRVADDGPVRASDPRTLLFARFRAMIEDRYVEHWPVSRYAEALAITESRLDRLCRALAGRSAFDMVQNRVLLEARRRLVHVAAPVSALAYELGFDDPAYFCRFFKRHVGCTPTDWRRTQRARLAGAA